jgi:hypothetical protein
MIYLSLLAALLLFVALVATLSRSLHPEPDLDFDDLNAPQELSLEGPGEDTNAALYCEILLRAFSSEDQRFIATLGDSRVERLLLFERKRIALRWIRRKSAEARLIMTEHVRRAREASDLRVWSELRLAFQYLEFRALCEFLALMVFSFGPAGLQGLALQTNATLLDIRRFGGRVAPDAGAAA